MPHGLEYIVRPFQSPGSLGNVVIPGQSKPTSEQAHISWGGVGTMPSVKIINPDVNVKTCDENLNEQGRDSDTVRIPIVVQSETEGYVDVQRAKKVKLDKQEKTYDENLGTTGYTSSTPKLDPRVASDTAWKSHWESSWGRCAVTWNLNNQ